jgi:hypothetical protein
MVRESAADSAEEEEAKAIVIFREEVGSDTMSKYRERDNPLGSLSFVLYSVGTTPTVASTTDQITI